VEELIEQICSKIWRVNPWSFKDRAAKGKGPAEPFQWAHESPEISVIISVVSELVASCCLTLDGLMLLNMLVKFLCF